jgi:hypothetical protein
VKSIRPATTNRHRPAQGSAGFVRAFAQAAAMTMNSLSGGVANLYSVRCTHLRPIDLNEENPMHPGEASA